MEVEPRATKELIKRGADAIQKVTGGAVHELGMLLGQNVALWRFKNAVQIAEKADQFLELKGIKPNQLPTGLRDIVPVFEYGSMEDEPSLQEMWAALLASYTIPEFAEQAQPKFHELLRQISAPEAQILYALFETKGFVGHDPYRYLTSETVSELTDIAHENAINLVLNLKRLGLLQGQERFQSSHVREVEVVLLTPIGREFMSRCTFFGDSPTNSS